MTTDIEALIAEARKWGPESMSSRLIARLADALEATAAERDGWKALVDAQREQAQKAHDALIWMAVELGWATDGTLPMAVNHAKQVLRVRTAERDEARVDAERRLRGFEAVVVDRDVAEAERDALRAIIDEALAATRAGVPLGMSTMRYMDQLLRDLRRILSRATTTEKGTEE